MRETLVRDPRVDRHLADPEVLAISPTESHRSSIRDLSLGVVAASLTLSEATKQVCPRSTGFTGFDPDLVGKYRGYEPPLRLAPTICGRRALIGPQHRGTCALLCVAQDMGWHRPRRPGLTERALGCREGCERVPQCRRSLVSGAGSWTRSPWTASEAGRARWGA